MTGAEPVAGLSPGSFRRGNVAEDPAADLAAQVFVLDLQESLPGVVRLRDWTLERLAPVAGETAVDVGSGTGSEVRRLAALVGQEGQAIGVEPHEGLRRVAEERVAGSSARFVDGDAADLPFPDASVQVIRCERVFQHLWDADAAVREFVRVLAPGGRVLVIDSDWGSQVQHPGDPGVVRRMQEAFWARTPNPFAGRLLRGQFLRAGLEVDPDVGTTAVIPPVEGLLPLLRMNADLAVEEGAVTRQEADDLVTEFVAAAGTGEAFLAVTMFAVLGRKA